MTEKEKAKAYDEAIERAKKSYGNRIAEEIFPELKESDDERIKKAIIEFFESEDDNTTYSLVRKKDIIAWLKKQGKNSIDKTKPRFDVGDWVVNKFGDSWHIDSLDKKNYQVSNGKGNCNYFPISKQDEMHLWTIQDARDGDVLSFYSEYKSNKMVQVGIIKKYVGKHGGCSNTFKIYVGVNWDNKLQIGKYMGCSINKGCSNIHPATKEQCDLLFQKIKEAGYKWNDETKTLDKLEDFGEVEKSSFHKGDWVVRGDTIAQILDIQEQYYVGLDINGKDFVSSRFSNVDKIHLWTMQDAKDGDVICYRDEISLYKNEIENCNKEETTFGGFVYYCCYDGKRFITNSFYLLTGQDEIDIYPATKEQRDALMKAMNNAGYKWDAKKNELKKND